ncbi:MAG: hypothetical protein MI799_04675 [Desulfobacterales bacterium]|nr:hypothetical protein [Desulfobacterales bacterium]
MFLRFSILLWSTIILFWTTLPWGIAESGVITLKAENEPLRNILTRLSKQAGYAIHINPEWIDFPITANFQNLPLGRAITAVFDKKLNYAVIWNEKDKKIKIFLYPLFSPPELGPAPGKKTPEFMPVPPIMNGRNIKFGQASRTTNY